MEDKKDVVKDAIKDAEREILTGFKPRSLDLDNLSEPNVPARGKKMPRK